MACTPAVPLDDSRCGGTLGATGIVVSVYKDQQAGANLGVMATRGNANAVYTIVG